MWGKIGINCFVLITGYFMCKSNITIRKFLKLFLQFEFYSIVIYFLFVAFDYVSLSWSGCICALIPIRNIGDNFVVGFLFFYLCIPFMNILIRNLDKRQHLLLIGLCLLIYTFFGTMPYFKVTMNYVSWFCVLYFISSYIRFYGLCSNLTHKKWGLAMAGAILISMLSVILILWIDKLYSKNISPYRFVQDSNTLLAVVTAVCSFMYFKDLKIKNNRVINAIASCTFGVLLIHANSDTMRQWLWQDTLKCTTLYHFDDFYIYAILIVFMVFILCAIIDYIRIFFIENYTFKCIDKILNKYNLR